MGSRSLGDPERLLTIAGNARLRRLEMMLETIALVKEKAGLGICGRKDAVRV